MEKRERIYPDGGRIGFFVSHYGEIAMEHYCKAGEEVSKEFSIRMIETPAHKEKTVFRGKPFFKKSSVIYEQE